MPPSPGTPTTPQGPTPPVTIATGLAKLALVFRHEAWQATGGHGLSPTQSQILATVAGTAHPMGIKGIAERLALTVGTVSAAVSTLVEKGLLSKYRSPDDARAVVIRLTADGQGHVDSHGEWPESMLAAAASLAEHDRAGLIRGLIALIRELERTGAVPTTRMCVECTHFRPNAHPGTSRPHHCQLIRSAIADTDLRIECAEMEPAGESIRPQLWNLLVNGRSLADVQ